MRATAYDSIHEFINSLKVLATFLRIKCCYLWTLLDRVVEMKTLEFEELRIYIPTLTAKFKDSRIDEPCRSVAARGTFPGVVASIER